jgi:hypothetical protein
MAMTIFVLYPWHARLVARKQSHLTSAFVGYFGRYGRAKTGVWMLYMINDLKSITLLSMRKRYNILRNARLVERIAIQSTLNQENLECHAHGADAICTVRVGTHTNDQNSPASTRTRKHRCFETCANKGYLHRNNPGQPPSTLQGIEIDGWRLLHCNVGTRNCRKTVGEAFQEQK